VVTTRDGDAGPSASSAARRRLADPSRAEWVLSSDRVSTSRLPSSRPRRCSVP